MSMGMAAHTGEHTLAKEELDPNEIDEEDEEMMTMWGTPLRDEPLHLQVRLGWAGLGPLIQK